MNILDSATPSNQVRILKIRANPKSGTPTRAYADVLCFGLITIRGVALIASKSGASDHFVSFPANAGKSGRFFSIIEIGEPLRSEIESLLLIAAKEAQLT